MAGSRIKMPQRISSDNPDVQVVQQRLHDTVQSIIQSPTLDSQVVSAKTQAVTTEQTVIFTHNLGRVPTGLHITGCTYLVASSGKQSFTSTTASINVVLSGATGVGTLTAVVF